MAPFECYKTGQFYLLTTGKAKNGLSNNHCAVKIQKKVFGAIL
jgi:hypothetical protein